jgi:aspartate-semialdehyde dehydrogenase
VVGGGGGRGERERESAEIIETSLVSQSPPNPPFSYANPLARLLLLSCTAVRIPTLRAHAEAITLETSEDITPASVLECLEGAPGIVVRDDPANDVYPMPLNCSGEDDVQVGRVRQSEVFGAKGVDLFVCGDQLLRGAALNAVLIAEMLEGNKGK